MKTVIKMAQESTLLDSRDDWNSVPNEYREAIERFAELARADEREKWAKFCETHIVWVGGGKRGLSELSEEELANSGIHQGMDYAAAIRARNNT